MPQLRRRATRLRHKVSAECRDCRNTLSIGGCVRTSVGAYPVRPCMCRAPIAQLHICPICRLQQTVRLLEAVVQGVYIELQSGSGGG